MASTRRELNRSIGVRGALLNASVSRVTMSALSSHTLEHQLDHALNAILESTFGGFGGSMSRLTSALVGGPVRDVLSTALVDAVHEAIGDHLDARGRCPRGPSRCAGSCVRIGLTRPSPIPIATFGVSLGVPSVCPLGGMRQGTR